LYPPTSLPKVETLVHKGSKTSAKSSSRTYSGQGIVGRLGCHLSGPTQKVKLLERIHNSQVVWVWQAPGAQVSACRFDFTERICAQGLFEDVFTFRVIRISHLLAIVKTAM